MPNLAFWKSNPFQSTAVATPGAVGSPQKPAGIAAAGKSSTPTMPSTGVAGIGPGTATSPVAQTGATTGYQLPNTGYPVGQYSNAATPSGVPTPSPTGYAPNYTASTAGVPGAGAYRAPPAGVAGANGPYGPTNGAAASPYGGATPYANPAATPYGSAPTAASYNATNPAAAAGGYAPAGASFDPRNPVRSATAYPSTDRYGSPAAGSNPGYAPSTSPAYGSIPQAAAGLPSSSPATGSRYSSPANATQATGNGGYIPPAPTGYSPGNTANPGYTTPTTSAPANSGYTVPATPTDAAPNANRYTPPGGFTAPPAGSGASEQPAYRPGSTSDYVPRRAGTPSSILPASYSQPVAGTGR